jgi:hypothetical protein
MRARQLIDGAAFRPDAMKAIGQAFDETFDEAFDEAWAGIAGDIGNVPVDIDTTMRGIGSPTRSYRSPVKTVGIWEC